jgi:drug/metabolite transporter (DMT)-like permease
MDQSTPVAVKQSVPITKVDLILILMVIFWGANITIIKVALKNFNPIAFNCCRFVLATTTLAILHRRIFADRIERKDWPWLILLGILGNTIYQFCFIYGVKFTHVSHVSILLATTPIFTAAISNLMGFENVGKKLWIGILLSFTGVVLIVFGRGFHIGSMAGLIGDILVFFSSLVWSIYTVFSKRIIQKYSPWHYIFYTIAIGTLILIPISIPSLLKQDYSTLGLYEWLAMAYAGLFGLVFGYSAWYYGVEKIGSTRTSVYSNLTPVAGLSVGMIFLGERLSLLQWLGALIIFCGLVVNRFAKREICPPE